VWDIVSISLIYFIVPIPLHYQVLSALFLTGGSSVLWIMFRLPLGGEYETLAVLTAFLITNVYGIFVSRRFNQSRRQQYILLLKEKKSRKELKLLAMTDSLTGVHNRRHFMSKASEELERTKRYGYPLSIMIFDLDNLKDVNDKYGHDAGDEVIRFFAKYCSSQLRSIDQLARFGGDEFVALLAQAGQDDAKEVAERIRTSIEDLEIQIDQEIITTTVSVGLTTTTDGDISVEELIKRADQALYDAKNNGRNQIAIM
jgi:diguanylate cyclase (GGDEF)-like protein